VKAGHLDHNQAFSFERVSQIWDNFLNPGLEASGCGEIGWAQACVEWATLLGFLFPIWDQQLQEGNIIIIISHGANHRIVSSI
jgi:hypothetical protein